MSKDYFDFTINNIDFKVNITKLTNNFYKKLSTEEKIILRKYKEKGYVLLNYLCRENSLNFDKIYFNNNFLNDNYNDEDYYTNKSIQTFKNPHKRDSIKYNLYQNIQLVKSLLYNISCIDRCFNKVNYKIKDLRESLNKSKKDFFLYRALDMPNSSIYKKGDILSHNQYLSCSSKLAVSTVFYDVSNKDSIILKIKNIDDCPFIFLDNNISYKENRDIKLDIYDEYECLLPRKCKFKVLKNYTTTKYNNYTYIMINLKNELFNKLNKDIDNITKYEINKKKINKLYQELKNKKIRIIEVEFIEYIKSDAHKILKLAKAPINKFIDHVKLIKHNFDTDDIKKNIIQTNKTHNSNKNIKKDLEKSKTVKISKKKSLKKKKNKGTHKHSKVNKKRVTKKKKNKNNKKYTGGVFNHEVNYFTDAEIDKLDISSKNGFTVVKYDDDMMTAYKKSDEQECIILFYVNEFRKLKYVILDNNDNAIKGTDTDRINELNLELNNLSQQMSMPNFIRHFKDKAKVEQLNKYKIYETLIEDLKPYLEKINENLKRKCDNLSVKLDFEYAQTNVTSYSGKSETKLLLCLNKTINEEIHCVSSLELYSYYINGDIVINSATNEKHMNKKYNKLLRCIAIKIFSEYLLNSDQGNTPINLLSCAVEPISALLLVKSYDCLVKLSDSKLLFDFRVNSPDNKVKKQKFIETKIKPFLNSNEEQNDIINMFITVPFNKNNLANANKVFSELISTDGEELKQVKCI